MYVRMCVALVERAIRAKKTTNWTAKTPKESSPIHRSGEGQTAVTRLFYQLGWTKGRHARGFGERNACRWSINLFFARCFPGSFACR